MINVFPLWSFLADNSLFPLAVFVAPCAYAVVRGIFSWLFS